LSDPHDAEEAETGPIGSSVWRQRRFLGSNCHSPSFFLLLATTPECAVSQRP